MKRFKRTSLLGHMALFVLIEIIFVFIVFREFPETNLYTTIGIAHSIYWLIVLLCSLWRERAKNVRIKALALWTPMVIHLLIHIFISRETFQEHSHGHDHHEGEEMLWLVIGTIVAGVLVYFGEKFLHTHNHCTTHHEDKHKACLEAGH